MTPRPGLQAEILVSLSLVMLTATGILAVLLAETHEDHVHQLRGLAARALLSEAHSPLRELSDDVPGLRWWTQDPGLPARARGGHAEPLDDAGHELAEAARRRGAPLLRSGRLWEPIRFAAPLRGGREVAIAQIPPPVSRGLVLGMLLADALVFTAFGATLLRRRVVGPLQRLAAAARAIADGGTAVRAPVEGVRETSEVGHAFNEMTEALERRSRALEKAVAELRDSNRRLRAARAGLDRAERLAAVGRLAAGVAHEVGNPMGALLAFLDLVERDPRLSPESRGYLERAAREGERVRTILRQLLDFSRPRRAARVPVDVAAVCEETAGLVRAQRRYAGIAIAVEAAARAPRALADPGAVSQIVLNLLLNAGDALAAAGEPRIRIRVRGSAAAVREGDEPEAATRRRRPDMVECRVEDNGPGVPEEDRERIFDPFFTTKTQGEGTGLGLSNAARLAEELGGSLELAAGAGPGAAFVLRLPAVAEGSSSDTRGGGGV